MKLLILTAIACWIYGFVVIYAEEEEGFVPLFDGKTLNEWQSARSTGEGDYGPFKICPKKNAIHVYKGEAANSEQLSDCLNTKKKFSKYTLRMEYKWLGKRFAPRTDYDRDAGLLFHVHGDLTKIWPGCMEMQIGETPGNVFKRENGRYHTGDLFVLGKHLRCKTKKDKNKRYDPNGELVSSSHCATPLGVEKPMGEWNQMEIVVDGAKSATFKFNGEVVHEIYDLEQQVDGKWVPLDEGHIGLQAEWAEIMYRNIRIKVDE